MDIDIDCQTNFNPLTIFPGAVNASMITSGKLAKHPCGVYFQTVPADPVTGLSAIPYQYGPDYGLFKVDFLHLSILNAVDNKEEVRQLANTEPDWSMLLDPEVVGKLFQLSKQYDLLVEIAPTSVEELADCIALIRPGKRHLISRYTSSKATTRKNLRHDLYQDPGSDQPWFKRAHAIAYSMTIVIQLHLIKQNRL